MALRVDWSPEAVEDIESIASYIERDSEWYAKAVELKRLLAAAGCTFRRPGKGDHEIWFSPISGKSFPVDSRIVSRHTANGVLEQAAHSSSAAYEVTPDSQLEVSKASLARLCRKYGVRKLSLFGSAARRTMNSTSDVDLLVEFAPESRTSLFDFPSMQRDFSEVFGNRRVDLVPPEVLKNPYRRKAILPDLRVLYEAR